MLRKMALSYELAGSSTSDTDQHVSQHHHSLTNTQANNLLGTHDLNTRLRVDNSSRCTPEKTWLPENHFVSAVSTPPPSSSSNREKSQVRDRK
ncbi:hypothetical protein F2Q69_00021429 [Brassica cretica]|uniref:Uncharacterized protein n=1 Tax=Brassica cretica TaxID=69181 RepID=A0A8S9Q7A6_BRACR|nr:hypothetical protein F2Q69_00021429 [Brassica cretica]